jgi:penicillin-binding protein 1A
MRNVVNEGTGTAAQLPRPVAGKTGTTDKEKDLWFMGFIPQIVTGVWLGNDNNTSTGGASSTAAYAWGRFMSQAVKDLPVQQFPTPDIEGQKAEIKLDRVRPNYQRTLAVPKDGESRGEDSEDRPRRRRVRAESSDEDRPRRRVRAERNEEETPRRRVRAERNEEETPRRRIRSESSNEERPRRRVRRRRSAEGNSSQPAAEPSLD